MRVSVDQTCGGGGGARERIGSCRAKRWDSTHRRHWERGRCHCRRGVRRDASSRIGAPTPMPRLLQRMAVHARRCEREQHRLRQRSRRRHSPKPSLQRPSRIERQTGRLCECEALAAELQSRCMCCGQRGIAGRRPLVVGKATGDVVLGLGGARVRTGSGRRSARRKRTSACITVTVVRVGVCLRVPIPVGFGDRKRCVSDTVRGVNGRRLCLCFGLTLRTHSTSCAAAHGQGVVRTAHSQATNPPVSRGAAVSSGKRVHT
jgi:hypothetical protein